jgi:hypothetical protein
MFSILLKTLCNTLNALKMTGTINFRKPTASSEIIEKDRTRSSPHMRPIPKQFIYWVHASGFTAQ